MAARAGQLKKHPPARRYATVLATVTRLRAKTIDDALDLLDLLMVTELAGRAHQQANKTTIRRWPRFAKASSRLAVAVAVAVLLEAAEWGEDVRLSEVLEMIDALVARPELRAALAEVTGTVPPPDADDGGWRAEMASHFPTVSGLVKTLTSAIEFEANTEGQAALVAMRSLPVALAYRSRYHSVTLPRRLIDASVVTGVWKRLVFGHPARTDGLVDRNACVFCVLDSLN